MAVFYSAVEVIEMAIKTEEAGKTFYGGVAKNTDNAKLKELFAFLAGEEEKHKQVFSDLYQTIKESPASVPYDWAEMSLYLKAITDSKFFLGKDKAINLVKEAKTPEQALDFALGFERDTMLFYTEIMTIVSEKNRDLIAKIVAQEKSHIRQLQALKEGLTKSG
ncbi:MAG: ferritin family protein [bacterium]|nr:ferritin family protein [candidate division WOR-3 bacterium]MDH5682854.1 ferritin family protein [candidate division WOR-3 bacterium]